MKKQFFVIMDIVNGSVNSSVFADKKTALKNASIQYSMFSSNDRNKRSEYYVCLSPTADKTKSDFASGQIIRRFK